MKSYYSTSIFSMVMVLFLSILVATDQSLQQKTVWTNRQPASETPGGNCGESTSHFMGRIPVVKEIIAFAKDIPNWGKFDMEAFQRAKAGYLDATDFQEGMIAFKEKTPIPRTAEQYAAYMEVINLHNIAEDGISRIGKNGEILPPLPESLAGKVPGVGKGGPKRTWFRVWKMKRAIKNLHGEGFMGKFRNLVRMNKKLSKNDIDNLFLLLYETAYGVRGSTPDLKNASARIMAEKFASEGIAELAQQTGIFLKDPNFIYKFMTSTRGKNLMNWSVVIAFLAFKLPPAFLPRIRTLYSVNETLAEVYAKAMKIGFKNLPEEDVVLIMKHWKTDMATDRFIEKVAPFFAAAALVYIGYTQTQYVIETEAEYDETKEVIDRLSLKLKEVIEKSEELEAKGFKIYSDRGKFQELPSGKCSVLRDCLDTHKSLIEAGRSKLKNQCKQWIDPHNYCS